MALEIRATVHQGKEALQGLYIREVLIGGSDNPASASTFDSGFDIFEQQNKASPLNKADRETEGAAPAQTVLDFFKEWRFSVVGEKLVLHRILLHG